MEARQRHGESRLIWLHPSAPPKPALGAACNGCGVCCAAEPCPVAIVFLRQRRGACRALEWQADADRYYCGMLRHPTHYLAWLPLRWQAWFSRRVARWIAVGSACDSAVNVE